MEMTEETTLGRLRRLCRRRRHRCRRCHRCRRRHQPRNVLRYRRPKYDRVFPFFSRTL